MGEKVIGRKFLVKMDPLLVSKSDLSFLKSGKIFVIKEELKIDVN